MHNKKGCASKRSSKLHIPKTAGGLNSYVARIYKKARLGRGDGSNKKLTKGATKTIEVEAAPSVVSQLVAK
jgi:hypothetical protein